MAQSPKGPPTEFWIWIASPSTPARFLGDAQPVKLRFPRDRSELRVRKQPGSEMTGQLNITFMAKHKITVMAQLTVIFMDLFHVIFHQLVVGVILP